MEVFREKGKKYNCLKNNKPYFRKSVVIDGKRYEVYGDGEKDAQRKVDELLTQSRSGIDLSNRNSKVGETFEFWLYNIKRVDRNLKDSSFSRYAAILKNHVLNKDIADRAMCKLTSAEMQCYTTALYEECGVSGATIVSIIKVWRMFTAWARDEGYFTKDPCRNIVIPGKRTKGTNKIETFSIEEREQIINFMRESKYQYDTLIILAFATGMRQGELLALTWDDIGKDIIHVRHSTAMVTHVDKNGKTVRSREVWDTKTENGVRDIPILPSISKLLQEHKIKQKEFFFKNRIAPTNFVFTTSTGSMIEASALRRSYQSMLNHAGVPYRKFHAIRHTFATEAIRSGVDVKDVQMLMGHSDIKMTYVYVHPDTESKRSAIEKMGSVI